MKLPWYMVPVDGSRGMAVRPRWIYVLWLFMTLTLREWCMARSDRWPINALCDVQWFRRWIGGRWEGWWLDVPVTAVLWFRVSEHNEERPHVLCRGTPTVEVWPWP